MTEEAKGLVAVVAAAAAWGVLGIYYHALSAVPAGEVLAHRIVWSFVFFAVWLVVDRRTGALLRVLKGPERWLILAAAIAVSFNWLVFIVAIQTGHALDSSLGYYILPLASVVLGLVVYRENPRPGQWLAIAIAALAVVILGFGLGVTPWTSLMLAVSFAVYGAFKKGISVDAMMSVTAEVTLLLPVALLWLVLPHPLLAGQEAHFGQDWTTTIMLVFTGPLTVLPLILFSYGSQRLPMATVGLTMYLNPTLQLIVAVMVFGEAFTRWHALAFVLIWLALTIYAAEGWRKLRHARG